MEYINNDKALAQGVLRRPLICTRDQLQVKKKSVSRCPNTTTCSTTTCEHQKNKIALLVLSLQPPKRI